MGNSLGVLGLEMGVTVHKVNMRYQFLAHRNHPNKHDKETPDTKSEKAVQMSKLVKIMQKISEKNYYEIVDITLGNKIGC